MKDPTAQRKSKNWGATLPLGALLLYAMAGQVWAQTPPTGQRLRTLQGPNFLIGSETDDNFWTLPDTAMYQLTESREFSIITPGNQLKWDVTEPQQNVFNFAPGDMHLAFAQANGMILHGHNLAWHQQNPNWLTSGTFTAAQLTAILQNHIANVVGHYKGKIPLWDVVNEAFNDDGTRRQTIWQNGIGSGYIETAFRAARAADPAAELVYNDFNIETVNAKSNAVLAMVQDFKTRGVPIDTVGIQGHLLLSGIDYASFATNMARFAAAGVKIRITELDVRMNVPPGPNDFQTQATVYQNVVHTCLQQPACKSIQLWGFTDKYSWVPGTFPGMGDALIFDTNYAAKPAYFAIQSQLPGGGNPVPTPTPTPTPTPIPTPTPTPTPPPAGACHVAYTIVNQWNTGFQADVKVTNNGAALNGWTLAFTFPATQQITQLWNGVATQTGEAVTTKNASYNASLLTGGTVDIGFTANWSGSNPVPTAFTLNGAACH